MFARVAFDLPVPTEFTYEVPERLEGSLRAGQRVRVPFRTQSRVGYLVALEETPGLQDPEKVKPIAEVVDPEPIVPDDLLDLARWISRYYCCSLGESLQAMLPGGVRRGAPQVSVVVRTGTGELPARAKKAAAILNALDGFSEPPPMKALLAAAGAGRGALKTLERAGLVRVEKRECEDGRLTPPERGAGNEAPLKLEPPQATALEAMRADVEGPRFGVHLLHGVTGSGKTEVYLRAIAETVARGHQAIVLVPEIALTPQTVRRFQARFERVEVIHSMQTEKTRRQSWKRIRRGEADVVIGPRSAIFAPVPNLGLLVVDEEHEGSFKQEHAPRYHARDVGIMRARRAGCPVVLGSATPSLESYRNAQLGRFHLHRLPKRARGYPLPPVRILDMTQQKDPLFSRPLQHAVADAVAEGGQAILFLNRRGFATLIVCSRCDHRLGCPHCSTQLVFHKGRRRTVCHICGHEAEIPPSCPECHAKSLQAVGFGTERVEEEAAKAWPNIPLERIDSDSVRGAGVQGSGLEEALERFRSGEVKVLIGTQMIAKGHHFPSVTLVGIVNADTALHLADFRANERTFTLIAQVAGRAGRSDKGGEVLVQTYNPDHYAIQHAARHDFEGFAERELEERDMLGLPPTRRCALLTVSAIQESDARAVARGLADLLTEDAEKNGVELRGPAKAPLERIRGRWRYMLLMLAADVAPLARLCQMARAARFPARIDLSIDVDPVAVL
ncbi:MAG: replication restart helicase PriA [Planctomycetota bacterium]|jgi:primosomal protein N' (replication factor Y)